MSKPLALDALIALFQSAPSPSGYFFTTSKGTGEVSSPHFEPIAKAIVASAGYAEHEAIFFHWDEETECLFFAFIHNTVRGLSQGGTRFLQYASLEDLLFDGLRLSRAMTEKNAVSEIWWGGGKAIICPKNKGERSDRKKVFQNYGKFVAKLKGMYYAAEDMNTTPQDMQDILSENRFVTCLPVAAGGSSNPSPWTALGVFKAMLAAMHTLENQDDLSGKTVAIQGIGNVGRALADLVLENGGALHIYDPYSKLVSEYAKKPNVTVFEDEKAFFEAKCDIFAPCARGGVVNPNTIPTMHCKYLIGAANNILENDARDARTLHEKGILYLPDFFVNRMGIINCADEAYGYLEDDLAAAVQKVFDDCVSLIQQSAERNEPPMVLALEQAKEKAAIPHPIWGHRGLKLREAAKGNF